MAEETAELLRLTYIEDEPGYKTVTLTKPYDDPFSEGKTFTKVRLREPTYKEIFMSGLGRPFEWQPGREGSIYVSFPDVVAKYIDRIAVSPEPTMLSQLGTIDSLRLERAVLGFFTASTG